MRILARIGMTARAGVIGLMAVGGALSMAQAADVPQENIYGPMPAADLQLADFKWEYRVVVIFADSPFDPAYTEQIELLETRPDSLIDRDVVVITDTDPEAKSPIRTALRPRGFSMVIVDKQGRVALRKPSPWSIREISASIDKMPMRLQELREQRIEALEAKE